MHKISEIKISYSSNKMNKEKISNSNSSYKLLKESWNMDSIELYEEFKVLLLNRANEPLGIFKVSQGGTASTIVDAKLIFSVALKCNASSIVLSHNHPSGNIMPSDSDIRTTEALKQAGKLLEITLLDHIILTAEAYYSFADEGLLN